MIKITFQEEYFDIDTGCTLPQRGALQKQTQKEHNLKEKRKKKKKKEKKKKQESSSWWWK